jgi:hypothetical protein
MNSWKDLDVNILLSIINTKLRNLYNCLESLCDDLNIDQEELTKQLSNINYTYDRSFNRFISID